MTTDGAAWSLAALLISVLARAAGPVAEAAADTAGAAGAADAAALPRGVMRTPRSSITISTLPPGPGGSMCTEGLPARPGTEGVVGGSGGSRSSLAWLTVRVKLQLKGGMCCSTPAKIINSTDSTTNRRQLMPTSQLA